MGGVTLLDSNQSLQCRIPDLRGELAVLHGFESFAEDYGQLSGVVECIDLEFSACDRQYFGDRTNFLAKSC